MASSTKPDIGRYRVLTELGQGGTANVFLAVASGMEGFNKLVVLKRMKPALVNEPGFATMFLDEARLAARLGHANIVQTYEVFKDGDLPVIVMEYLEGQTLANTVAKRGERSGFELWHHLAVVSEALSGLEYSHELLDFDRNPLEVVHRDLTPHNVFVTFDGQVKVLDFGIAKLSGSLVETESGVIKGKLRYIPPEQMVNEDVDRRADIYSVGVMLWEAASGEKMWRGVSDATLMNRVINGKIPRPSELNPGVAPELEELVMKALSPDREDRHPTAKALQEALDRFRATLPVATARELGPVVGRLFENERAERRRTIEAHLRDARLTPSLHAKATDEPSGRSFARSEISTTQKLGRANGILLASGAAGLCVVAVTLWPEAAETPAAEATSSTPTDGVKEPQTVEIRVVASPAGARITIDGVESKENPATAVVALDRALHVVRAEAPGYEEAQETVRFDRSRSIVLRLSRRPEPASPVSVVTKEPPKAPPRAARSQSPACEPPFVIDARGIKRFKPECVE